MYLNVSSAYRLTFESGKINEKKLIVSADNRLSLVISLTWLSSDTHDMHACVKKYAHDV